MTGSSNSPRYRLDSRIATGGMGEVWRATDTVLSRQVAVKVLKREYADDPAFRARFEREARHAAALHHPGVASVFDFGELPPDDADGEVPRPYLVMELVPGQPLSTLLRGGEPMPPETATDLAAQAADALSAAHALGIVHRDIKPANLLVTPDGRVKITDFGIARAADTAAITQTGQVLGTPAYLSPEQAEGKASTAASDVYSLGVVVYECLAGARPFQRDTPVATALAHLRDDPPSLPDSVPEQLRSTVAMALAKDPADRFGSMDEFAAALRGAPVTPAAVPVDLPDDDAGSTRVIPAPVAAPPPATPAAPRSQRRRPPWLPWAAAALAVLVLVLLVAWLGQGDEPNSPAGDTASNEPSPSPSARSSPSPPESSPAQPESSPAQPESTSATPEEPVGVEVVAADYIGMPKDEAKARLQALGLKVKEEKVENDGSFEEDDVTDVVPAGTLQEGDEVTILVAGEPVAEPLPEGSTVEPPGQNKSKGKKD